VLFALAKSLALSGVVAAVDAGRRAATTVAAYVVAGVLFAVSLCFLTLAGYRAMVDAMGEVYASLIVGCVYFVAGLIALLVIQFRRR
jgi:quinol-cytochrome oxidoreductase complex cytochrome b subunit